MRRSGSSIAQRWGGVVMLLSVAGITDSASAQLRTVVSRAVTVYVSTSSDAVSPMVTVSVVGPMAASNVTSQVVTVLVSPRGPAGFVEAVSRAITLRHRCPADFDDSGGTPDTGDIDAFFLAWLAGDPAADVDRSGGTPDSEDIDYFFSRWLTGGC
jgi:hypothetical protein